jgi:hypothetical protein
MWERRLEMSVRCWYGMVDCAEGKLCEYCQRDLMRKDIVRLTAELDKVEKAREEIERLTSDYDLEKEHRRLDNIEHKKTIAGLKKELEKAKNTINSLKNCGNCGDEHHCDKCSGPMGYSEWKER